MQGSSRLLDNVTVVLLLGRHEKYYTRATGTIGSSTNFLLLLSHTAVSSCKNTFHLPFLPLQIPTRSPEAKSQPCLGVSWRQKRAASKHSMILSVPISTRSPPNTVQFRYEGKNTEGQPHSKSTGQLGDASDNTTHDPANTAAAAEQQAERGEKTAENVRYVQTISEGGMGGMTSGQNDGGEQEGYGRVGDKAEDGDAKQQRREQGYGGEKDMDREIGA